MRRINEYVLAEMIKASDVKGLSEVFQKAENWDTREWAVVALGNICKDKNAGIDYDKSEMIKTLKDISQVCKAERTGGTYRTACLEHAQMLLEKLGEQPLPTAEERDVSAKKPDASNEDEVKAKVDRTSIIEGLKKISPVQVSDWVITFGNDFGPMAPEGSTSMGASYYELDEVAEFILRIFESRHYEGGKEEVIFGPDHAIVEIHGQSGLRTRYVILRDSKSDKYLCYISWLA